MITETDGATLSGARDPSALFVDGTFAMMSREVGLLQAMGLLGFRAEPGRRNRGAGGFCRTGVIMATSDAATGRTRDVAGKRRWAALQPPSRRRGVLANDVRLNFLGRRPALRAPAPPPRSSHRADSPPGSRQSPGQGGARERK